jgi:hypothetical protein
MNFTNGRFVVEMVDDGAPDNKIERLLGHRQRVGVHHRVFRCASKFRPDCLDLLDRDVHYQQALRPGGEYGRHQHVAADAAVAQYAAAGCLLSHEVGEMTLRRARVRSREDVLEACVKSGAFDEDLALVVRLSLPTYSIVTHPGSRLHDISGCLLSTSNAQLPKSFATKNTKNAASPFHCRAKRGDPWRLPGAARQ